MINCSNLSKSGYDADKLYDNSFKIKYLGITLCLEVAGLSYLA